MNQERPLSAAIDQPTGRWRKEGAPGFGVICLCRGDSYDAGYHDGHLLAYHTGDSWVTGKQQAEVLVTEWIPLAELGIEAARLRELLEQHQEIGRLQGNQLDEALRELGITQAKLRAAQWENQNLRTQLKAYSAQNNPPPSL